MNHFKAILIKFIATFVVLYIILGAFYDMAFRNVFLISLVLTVAAYVIGDMLILRMTNNTVATIADFGLAFLVIWFMGESLTFGDSLFTAALISAAGIALFEIFFHKYVANRSHDKTTTVQNRPTNLRYQTEASEEFTPDRNLRNNDDK